MLIYNSSCRLIRAGTSNARSGGPIILPISLFGSPAINKERETRASHFAEQRSNEQKVTITGHLAELIEAYRGRPAHHAPLISFLPLYECALAYSCGRFVQLRLQWDYLQLGRTLWTRFRSQVSSPDRVDGTGKTYCV